MPGKWTEQAERDLIFAVLASHTGGDLKVKVAWDAVKDQMHAWGHTDFTKEAMNQRWSKTIVKDFKEGKGGDTFRASTAAKDTTAAAGRKRKTATPKSAASAAPVDDRADDDEEENGDEEGGENKPVATPTPKRRKPSAKAEPKAEPVPKKEEPEQEQKSIFGGGHGVKPETPDEA